MTNKTFRVYQVKTFTRVVEVDAASFEEIAEMIRAKGDALEGNVKDEFFSGPTRWDIEDIESDRIIALQDLWKEAKYAIENQSSSRVQS